MGLTTLPALQGGVGGQQPHAALTTLKLKDPPASASKMLGIKGVRYTKLLAQFLILTIFSKYTILCFAFF